MYKTGFLCEIYMSIHKAAECMSELREMKKENRRKRIFQSALKLFGELGFQKTTMEKIATEAQLGVGTLYNYYPSKIELLFSILKESSNKYIEELNEVISTCRELGSSIMEFYYIYLKSFSTYSKKVWSEVFGEVFLKQQDSVKMIDIIDKQFLDKIREMLNVLKKRQQLKDDVDLNTAANLLYAVLAFNIIRYLVESNMNENELIKVLKTQSQFIIESMVQSEAAGFS